MISKMMKMEESKQRKELKSMRRDGKKLKSDMRGSGESMKTDILKCLAFNGSIPYALFPPTCPDTL